MLKSIMGHCQFLSRNMLELYLTLNSSAYLVLQFHLPMSTPATSYIHPHRSANDNASNEHYLKHTFFSVALVVYGRVLTCS